MNSRQLVCYTDLQKAMTNKEIATLLRHVAASYVIKDEKKFRFQIMAYQKAADAIENTTSEIKDLIKENILQDLPGIGPTIKSHLEELIKTGRVKHFVFVMKGIPSPVYPLLDVPSFGPKKAFKLVSHFKLTNPTSVGEDILTLAKKGEIASLEGFGEKSQQDIIRALEEFKKGKTKTNRMTLPYAWETADKLLSYLKKSSAVSRAYTLGSLRRMSSMVGDIDIAVASDMPRKVIEHFVAYPYKERVIEKGGTTASLLLSSGKQIDLMVQPPNRFGSLLQHFTGSKNHNVRLREYALSRGLSLSEYGIKKKEKGKWVTKTFKTEESFYSYIGLDWIPPELREDKEEIQAAHNHTLPHLVEYKDIQGDLHLHSNFLIEPSHDLGQNSMEEMILEALRLGYKYIGFSEHNPSVSKHTPSQTYEILKRKREKVDILNSNNKNIRVINLLETDILANGDLAIDDKSIGLLDALIVSIHSNLGMDRKSMTKRVLKGLSHPRAKILCHPTGRLLNEREGYSLEWNELFEFCKKYGKALEINSWPTRLDLPDIMVKEAQRTGVVMAINTDSHAVFHMKLMEYGVSVARRGWAETKDILNTRPYQEFIQWLKD